MNRTPQLERRSKQEARHTAASSLNYSHHTRSPQSIREVSTPRTEACAADFAYPVYSQDHLGSEAARLATIGNVMGDGDSWEVEYQAWLDVLEVQSRIHRGLKP